MIVDRNDLASKTVVDVGSRDVNGSSRHLFDGAYTGIDVESGPGVDVVCDIERWLHVVRLGSFDVVLSTEMLEHCFRPWLALGNMASLARRDGDLILTCRGYDSRGAWELHDAPDLWRFSRSWLTWALRRLWRESLVEADPAGPGWLCWAHGPLPLAERGGDP